jgi:IMP dehydrogenase
MDQENSDSLHQDSPFYLPARGFFETFKGTGLTFDDISLATNHSAVLPRETKLETRLSESLTLALPFISSDMDTVTEAEMATAMALNGGMGLIHYNMSPRQQIKHVAKVKNHVHGLIQDPITVQPDQRIEDIIQLIESKGYSFRTFPVVDESGVLIGLLPGQVVKKRYAERSVREAMTARSDLYTIPEDMIRDHPIEAADRFFHDNIGIHKLLVVDSRDRLCGLFTLSDIERIAEESQSDRRPARDAKFRLVCGAAISAPRTAEGQLDRNSFIEHVGALVDEGVDAVAISTAHGFSEGVGTSVQLLRDAFPNLTLIAGNVTSKDGVEFLARAGADAIKVGQGPGSICTTRIVAGVGIPQMTALYDATRAETERPVALIADGGISKSGDIVKALSLADAVMCGSLFAGCREAPGKIMEINGKLYKEYRGMGSLDAMKAGAAARYGHKLSESQDKIAAEGIEALKEVAESVNQIITQLAGGLQSGLGYLGAANLGELKTKARYVRVTDAGMREAKPHDIVEVKTTASSRN